MNLDNTLQDESIITEPSSPVNNIREHLDTRLDTHFDALSLIENQYRHDECPICLELFILEDGTNTEIVIECGHSVCDTCIEELQKPENLKWGHNNALCPICKISIRISVKVNTNTCIIRALTNVGNELGEEVYPKIPLRRNNAGYIESMF